MIKIDKFILKSSQISYTVFKVVCSRLPWYVSKDGFRIHADVNGAFNIGRKVIPNSFNCLQEIVVRDRGCLVVHPRRLTPVFCPKGKIGVA